MISPKVYVSILNWYNYETSTKCVSSVLESIYENFEVIVVDNGSKNRSLSKLRQRFPNLRIIDAGENLGYAGGNKLVSDLAIKENAELLGILNNDTVVRPDALSHLVESYMKFGEAVYSNTTLMSEDPDIIHYSGRYTPTENSISKQPYDKLKGVLFSEVKDKLEDREARIYGHSLLIPLSVIRKHGFMDTEYFLFYEEEDYFKMLQTKNITTRYVKNAIVLHESSGSFKNTGVVDSKMKLPLLYYGERNRYHFNIRWNHYSKSQVLASKGGWFSLLKFFIRFWLSSKEWQHRYAEDRMHNLAALHAFVGKRGKTMDPANFRSDTANV